MTPRSEALVCFLSSFFHLFPLGQRLVSRCTEEALQGEPKANWKTAIKRSLGPRGFPPILKCPTVLTAKTTTDELFCGHFAAFEANPRPVDRSLTAINNDKREITATSSKGKWRMKAKLQGSGPKTCYAEKISHPNLRWPVQSSRTHDDGLTHKNTDWKFTVSLPTYACDFTGHRSDALSPRTARACFSTNESMSLTRVEKCWENELQTDTKLTVIDQLQTFYK